MQQPDMGVKKMVTMIMDMTSGTRLEDVERYGEEVLNASWLPQPMLQLAVQTASAEPVPAAVRQAVLDGLADPEGFLRRLYVAQE